MKHIGSKLAYLCVLMLLSAPAFAYIDPGTGSALIQGIIAAIAAIGITLKLYWYRILKFLGLKKDSTPTDASKDENSQ